MVVRINAANEDAPRFQYSTSNSLIHHTILRDYSILFSIYREFDINGNTIIRQYFLDYIREVLQCFKEVENGR